MRRENKLEVPYQRSNSLQYVGIIFGRRAPFVSLSHPCLHLIISAYAHVHCCCFLVPECVASDWTCSFPFVNATAQAVFRIDSTTVNVQCVAPLNIQAIAASQTLSCALLYQASGVYILPFDLTFSAPPLPSLISLAVTMPKLWLILHPYSSGISHHFPRLIPAAAAAGWRRW